MRLQRRDPVDDVDARLLELLRPADVRALVEARLQLHQADRLLAALGRLDQVRDQRRVGAGAVDRLLDREHVGVGDRLLDEALDRAGERVVGVMDEDVAGSDRREHVALLALGAEQQPRRGHRRVRRIAQLVVAGEPDHVPEVAEVHQPLDLVDLVVGRAERDHQLVAQPFAHPGVDFEPHDLAEATPPQLLLDRLQQVVGLVGDVVVGVAGDPEERVVEHLHPREQRLEVVGDQGVERDQRLAAVADADEPAQELLRHLHPGEDLVVLLGIAQDHCQRERQVRDVGERPPAADHERGQDREHLPLEQVRRARRVPRPRPARG